MRLLLLALILIFGIAAAADDRIHFKLDTSESDAVLAILEKHAAGHAVSESDWQAVFTSEPYQRLKKREAGMTRDFTDESFKSFVLSEELARKASELRRTLDAWKKADLRRIANRILPISARQRTGKGQRLSGHQAQDQQLCIRGGHQPRYLSVSQSRGRRG